MAFEHTQNVERNIQPQPAELACLSVSNSEMSKFQTSYSSGKGASIAEREMELFGSGFSFDQVVNPYGASDSIAWEPRQAYTSLQDTARGTDIVRQMSLPDVTQRAEQALFPLRGKEDQRLAEVTQLDVRAWENAAAIPELAGKGISANVLKALVRNELHWYDAKDARDDNEAKAGKDPGRTATLGFAQISQKGIAEFERDIPEFKKFLESKGYTGPGHELRALEDPRCAPMIVAAKLASLAKAYESYNAVHPDQPVKINASSLIYGYNADVQARSEGGKIVHESMPDQQAAIGRLIHHDLHKVYPTSDPDVLNSSHHVANVLGQLKIIENQQK